MSEVITCPSCGNNFQPSDVLRSKLEADLRAQMNAQFDRRLENERKQAQVAAQAQLAPQLAEVARIKEQASAWRTKAQAADVKEAELLKRQREFEEKEQSAALDLERKLVAERDAIRKKALAEAEQRAALAAEEVLRSKNEELEASQRRLVEFADREAKRLEEQRVMKQKLESMELEIQKRLSEEMAKARDEQARAAAEEKHLTKVQHEEKLSSLQRTIDDLQRKVQQGSQQSQGEAQEVALREVLSRAFPRDEFDDVPKGARGADLIQRVKDDHGNDCGTILWESKRTKTWSDEWCSKLREDQHDIAADVCVIASQALPADLHHFGQRKGVWVSAWPHAVAVAAILRTGLVETSGVRRSLVGSTEKRQLLYNYMTSPQFKNRIGGALEAVCEAQADLDKEKRAIQSQWKKRERQFERIMLNLQGFYGDVKGLAGREVPSLEQLEFDSAPELMPGEREVA